MSVIVADNETFPTFPVVGVDTEEVRSGRGTELTIIFVQGPQLFVSSDSLMAIVLFSPGLTLFAQAPM